MGCRNGLGPPKARTPAKGQTASTNILDTRARDTYWAKRTGTITAPHTLVKVLTADPPPTTGNWPPWRSPQPPAQPDRGTTYGYDSQATAPAPPAGQGSQPRLPTTRPTGSPATPPLPHTPKRRRAADVQNSQRHHHDVHLGPVQPTAAPARNGSDDYIYGPGGQPIEKISGTTITYLHQDQQGSTRLLTDATGDVVGTYSYDPYGTTPAIPERRKHPCNMTASTPTPKADFSTCGRGTTIRPTAQFLTADPLLPATGEAYSFAGENPLNAFDPTGLSWYNPLSWSSTTWSAIGLGVAVVGVGVLTLGAGDVADRRGVGFVSVTSIETETLAITKVTAVSVSAEFTLGEAVGAAEFAATARHRPVGIRDIQSLHIGRRGELRPSMPGSRPGCAFPIPYRPEYSRRDQTGNRQRCR